MRKRLIYRCDDVGMSETYDIGIFKVIEDNIGCSADVMFDAEHAVEALRKLKEKPWLSIGWHRHLWGRPVLPAKEVPSMVNDEGRFKWGHDVKMCGVGVEYEEAYREFKAEMQLCYYAIGKYPDVAPCDPENDLPMEKAFCDVVREYNIASNYFSLSDDFHGRKKNYLDPKYEHLHIVSASIATGHMYDMNYWDEYQPIEAMTRLQWTDKEEIYFYGWHPGFVDDMILSESSCNIHRVRENIHARSKEYKDWIISNHIELINFRDALYGTNEYQDHLKKIDSPLWIGNMKG
ncbi:MAG: ChbG/HpnK family deacetylase [Erysipelotrichaceae bacterium]|nr:ChbG/HpnK family deacetylase [Erysipelotrichaceae bacterium]